MAKLVFILGGARSGKSDFAQRLAAWIGGDDVLYVATAEALDDEMASRIQLHQKARPEEWRLIEAPVGVGRALSAIKEEQSVVIIDCLTLLVSNLMTRGEVLSAAGTAEESVEREIAELLTACRQRPGTVIVVSNEVGLGVVPNSALGRDYRDLLGRANQHVAEQADATYLMVAGRPVDLGKVSPSMEQIAADLGRDQHRS